jgi:predicted HTH domain antitoxin
MAWQEEYQSKIVSVEKAAEVSSHGPGRFGKHRL